MKLFAFAALADALVERFRSPALGELEWAPPGLYPEAADASMWPIARLGVVSIEFLPLNAAIARTSDGRHRRILLDFDLLEPCLSMLEPSASDKYRRALALSADDLLRSWPRDHRLLFADAGDGFWRFARRSRLGRPLPPHPERLLNKDPSIREHPLRFSLSAFRPWAERLADRVSDRLPFEPLERDFSPSLHPPRASASDAVNGALAFDVGQAACRQRSAGESPRDAAARSCQLSRPLPVFPAQPADVAQAFPERLRERALAAFSRAQIALSLAQAASAAAVSRDGAPSGAPSSATPVRRAPCRL
jgi:hypothetical protein